MANWFKIKQIKAFKKGQFYNANIDGFIKHNGVMVPITGIFVTGESKDSPFSIYIRENYVARFNPSDTTPAISLGIIMGEFDLTTSTPADPTNLYCWRQTDASYSTSAVMEGSAVVEQDTEANMTFKSWYQTYYSHLIVEHIKFPIAIGFRHRASAGTGEAGAIPTFHFSSRLIPDEPSSMNFVPNGTEKQHSSIPSNSPGPKPAMPDDQLRIYYRIDRVPGTLADVTITSLTAQVTVPFWNN